MSVPFTSYERIREGLADWVADDVAACRALGRAEWIVTEKIHGASFCFVVSEDGMRVRRRVQDELHSFQSSGSTER